MREKMSTLFNLIPKKESFKKAMEFIKANDSLSYAGYLRLFIKKYSKKITVKNFTEILVRMFDAIEDGE